MKHFLDINKTNLDDLNRILEQAKKTKITRTGFSNGAPDQNQALSGKMVALIFEKPSTRTRVSFDMGFDRWVARLWFYLVLKCK